MNKLLLVPLALSAFSTSALAQRYSMSDYLDYSYYDDYNYTSYNCSEYRRAEASADSTFRGRRARRRARQACERRFGQRSDAVQAVEACMLGRQAAMRVAAYRIADTATRDGILLGYNCGVDRGIEAGNTSYNRRRGAENITRDMEYEIQNDTYGSLQRYAVEPAQAAANSQATTDVISLFSNAVTTNGGMLPSNQANVPRVNFSGVNGGYEKNRRSVPTIEGLLRAEYDEQYIDLDSYFSHDYYDGNWRVRDRRFRRSRRGMSINHGVPRSLDGLRIWTTLENAPRRRFRNLPPRIRQLIREYQALSNERLEVHGTRTVQPPALDDGTVPPPIQEPTLTYEVSPRQIFRDVFDRVWEPSLDRAYNNIVERNLDRGFAEGFDIGANVGEVYAYNLGLRDEYNRLYQRESQIRYNDAFGPEYVAAHAAKYDQMANNAEIRSTSWSIVEEDRDGVLLVGERFGFTVESRNIGGAGTRTDVRGGVNSREASERADGQYVIAPLSSRPHTTNAFLTVPEVIDITQSSARITVAFATDHEYGTRSQTVFNPAGFDHRSPRADLRNGELKVPVIVSTPFTTGIREQVTVKLYSNVTGDVLERTFDGLPAGSQEITFTIKKDFFEMLDQTYNFKVELSFAGEVMQSRENLTVTINKQAALAEYFDHLVLNRDAVLPGTYDEQFARYKTVVMNDLEQEIDAVINGLNNRGRTSRRDITRPFRDAHYVNNSGRQASRASTPGLMTQIYLKRPGNEGRRERRNTPAHVNAAYRSLGNSTLVMIYNKRNNVDGRRNQSSYRDAMCGLASSALAMLQNEARGRNDGELSFNLGSRSRRDQFKCEL